MLCLARYFHRLSASTRHHHFTRLGHCQGHFDLKMQIIIHQALSIKEMQQLPCSEHLQPGSRKLPVVYDSLVAANIFTHAAALFKTAARLRPAVATARSPICGQKCHISGLFSTHKIRPLYGIGTHVHTLMQGKHVEECLGCYLVGWCILPTDS